MQLAGGKVAAGQDDVGFRDDVQAGFGRIGDRTVGIERAERDGVEHFSRCFREGFALSGQLGDVVLGRDGRHPDDRGADRCRVVDGMRVDAAVRVVEHEPREQAHATVGKQLLEDQGMRHAEIVVILVEQRAKTRSRAIHQRFVVVKDAEHRGRSAVAMEIDGAHQQRVHLVGTGIRDRRCPSG
jgi:hypothetical protein